MATGWTDDKHRQAAIDELDLLKGDCEQYFAHVAELVKAARALTRSAERNVSHTVAYTTNRDVEALEAALKPFEE